MVSDKIFLLFAALGLIPMALLYGAAPDISLPWLFDIDASGPNNRQLYRAVMGLYLALVVFWTVGAFRERLRITALWSVVIFMWGLAAGRALSLVLDGFPHPVLFAYLVLELALGAIGLMEIRRAETSSGPEQWPSVNQ